MFADVLLGLVCVLLLALVVTAAMNLYLGVPSVPTPMPVVREIVKLAELKAGDHVVDLGAGDGRLLIEAKRSCSGISARGCELIPMVWLMGKMRILFSGLRLQLSLKNAMKEDLRDADVIFLYLFPKLMKDLLPKFDRELRPKTRIISYMFRLPGRAPVTTKVVKGFWGEAKVFIYEC